MSKTEVVVTGARLMDIRSGFLALSNRKLPAVSDMRVAMMFAKLRPMIDSYVEVLKKLQTRQEEAERLDEGSAERAIEEAAVAVEVNALTSELYTIPVPSRRLNEADLPPAFKSKDGSGEANAAGRAAIAVSLSPEFFELKDPDAAEGGPQLVDDDDES